MSCMFSLKFGGEESDEVTSTLLKASVHARVCALVIERKLKKKKNQGKKQPRRETNLLSLTAEILPKKEKKIARKVEFLSLPTYIVAQGCGITAYPGEKRVP